MSCLVACPYIPYETISGIPPEVKRVAYKSVIGLIFSQHTAAYGSAFMKGFRFKVYHSCHSICAILQRCGPPDYLYVIYGIRVNKNTVFITPLKILLSLTIHQG